MGGLPQPDPTKSSVNFEQKLEVLTLEVLNRKKIGNVLKTEMEKGDPFKLTLSLNGDSFEARVLENVVHVTVSHKRKDAGEENVTDTVKLMCTEFKHSRADMEVVKNANGSKLSEEAQEELLDGLRKLSSEAEQDKPRYGEKACVLSIQPI